MEEMRIIVFGLKHKLAAVYCTSLDFICNIPVLYQSQRSKILPSHQHTFMNTVIKQQLVSAPSLGHKNTRK